MELKKRAKASRPLPLTGFSTLIGALGASPVIVAGTSMSAAARLDTDMVLDNPRTWLFHCHVGPHVEGGMASTYTVLPAGGTNRTNPNSSGGES